MKVQFGPLVAAQDGLISPTYDEAKMSAYMKNQELEVSVDVGVGRGTAPAGAVSAREAAAAATLRPVRLSEGSGADGRPSA